ncbi:TPA: type II toxin-antitoxin system RelE/ParE family toxin [Pseudomonas aeruginosa]|uniref:type II toxin-antitoxin system RelE/ParE family toxin n=1 Tax=Pseudomonas aeruginosa TaxID=287 RepID=UPI0022CDBDDB|nr:type II toxin-antitoxin system RelE/ParE family toxin [Pseudomonas aeruginosa]MBX6583435.1 type II toxin-antitoxin system RelE/ParE family toxin [Pseudomonas aeruginosa]MBX6631794.1 type II toxin-antitoxin system RelE/ParE family toxin [Pseudomonas aeruginosa]MCZ9831446.1 type II toxin-antitoxin system RelE/ParE family toxin [Pseudomonas aeruginosa]HBO2152770.1 type II toxin-antitoxin system RelE/ParE family toxin [Pseudomonas aeruginosa]HCI2696229.1 type II toxin-antitoxin system RelE/ParE
MLGSFKSKALKRLNNDDVSKVHPDHVEVIQDILAIMKASSTLQDVALPGMRLHPWNGGGKKKAKIWSLDVSGNFRLLFKHDKETGQFYDLDYDDPH